MPITNFGDIGSRTAGFAVTENAQTCRTNYGFAKKFGLMKKIPANRTDTIKFRRPVPLGPSTTPLTEGLPQHRNVCPMRMSASR